MARDKEFDKEYQQAKRFAKKYGYWTPEFGKNITKTALQKRIQAELNVYNSREMRKATPTGILKESNDTIITQNKKMKEQWGIKDGYSLWLKVGSSTEYVTVNGRDYKTAWVNGEQYAIRGGVIRRMENGKFIDEFDGVKYQ